MPAAIYFLLPPSSSQWLGAPAQVLLFLRLLPRSLLFLAHSYRLEASAAAFLALYWFCRCISCESFSPFQWAHFLFHQSAACSFVTRSRDLTRIHLPIRGTTPLVEYSTVCDAIRSDGRKHFKTATGERQNPTVAASFLPSHLLHHTEKCINFTACSCFSSRKSRHRRWKGRQNRSKSGQGN